MVFVEVLVCIYGGGIFVWDLIVDCDYCLFDNMVLVC